MTAISPYKLTPVPPTIALLTENADALDEHGELHDLDALPKGTRCYASWDTVDELLRAGVGETYCWDGEPIRWRHRRFDDFGGWTARHSDVTVFRLPFPADEHALRGLVNWRDWLGFHGAAPQGSLGSSAMSLLRARIGRKLWTARGQLPPVRWTLGGRQELAVPPRSSISAARHFDLPAAYARVLGELRYGGVWRELEPTASRGMGFWAQGGRPVFCHARVRVPTVRFGPLPRRPRHRPAASSWDRCEVLGGGAVALYPTSVSLQGTWTADELAEAERAGASITVDRLWVHITETGELGQPFLPWWETVLEGRAMDGLAGQLAKASANALWGQFCITEGQRELVSVVNGERQVRKLHSPGGGMPRSWDLAETITGRVRSVLAGLMRVAGDALVSVHTDGGWVAPGLEPPEGWLVKDEARRLDILGPQVLRYWRPRGGVHHRVAGVPTRRAEQTFEALWQGAA